MELIDLLEYIYFRLIYSDIEKFLTKIKYEGKDNNIVKDKDLNFGYYNKYIKDFISTFKNNFPKKCIKNLYRNINTLEIIEKNNDDIFISNIALGEYYLDENRIIIEKYPEEENLSKYEEETIKHELLHMASTRNTEIGYVSGFEIPGLIGKSINEGYTNYLNKKYFIKNNDIDTINIFLAKGIENIVSSSNMKIFYFNARIDLLINEISKYTPKEEVIKLIFDIDRINQRIVTRKDYKRIINKIANINLLRQQHLLKEGVISKEDYEINKAMYVTEYSKGIIWDEYTTIIKDKDSFIFKNNNRKSPIYIFSSKEKKKKIHLKNYHISLK